jgi:hypothetical protein
MLFVGLLHEGAFEHLSAASPRSLEEEVECFLALFLRGAGRGR